MYMVFITDTGNNRKSVNFTYSWLYAFGNRKATPNFNIENVNLLSNPHVNLKYEVAY